MCRVILIQPQLEALPKYQQQLSVHPGRHVGQSCVTDALTFGTTACGNAGSS